ncbi:phage tail tube protein [Streptococcus respiraculi]|uniref:phage tail tube protein n=1 Tax=Streptococcus respiraculi TaxID=2021971 RepID=UPI000E74F0FA|nr:phage tail protein [Streptococcus respiraculi]
MSNATNVTAAKPKVGGAIYSAPLGTKLPTNATSKLDAAFVALGYVSEDGATNSNSPSSENIKAWGGDTVNSVQTEKEDTFSYTLIEALNVDVLKEVYGNENVSGDLSTGITITANSKELKEHCIIIEMLLKGGAMKRIVLPCAKVSEVGEISYKDGENVGYEITIQALPDEHENTHYEYIQAAKPTVGG